MSTLLVVTDETGAVKHLPLGTPMTLGGSEPGSVSLPGLVGTVLHIDPSNEGLKLEVKGPETVLVNGRPPDQFGILRPGDEITLGTAHARIVSTPDLEILDDPRSFGHVSRAEPAGSGGAAEDRPVMRALLRGICEILTVPKSEAVPLDRLLDLALEVSSADRAVFVVRGPDGVPRTRAIRPASDEAGLVRPLVLSGKILADALADGLPALAQYEHPSAGAPGAGRSLLLVPVRGLLAPSGAICLESSRTVEDIGAAGLEDLAALGLAAGVALERHRSRLLSGETERLTTIGRTMAGVAHDIKNLITGMHTGAYFLDTPLSSHETTQIREAWRLLKASQMSVETLVTNMVSYSKPQTLSRTLADLEPTITRAVDLSRGWAETKGADLVTELAAVPVVLIDEAALERCIVNLIANAVDAVPPDAGRIVVRLTTDGEEALIEIEDNGPGIPEDERARVFDLHFTTKGAGGTGFGLTIARSIIEGHGGALALEDRGEPGATFVIRLPLKEVPTL